ncbi:MAG: alpha/beta fold hydrolase [Jhaorihella sp.]
MQSTDLPERNAGERLIIPAGQTELSGRLFLPAGAPVAAVVLNGATGVPQAYYRHFARWLAESRDMACLTYDYRDFGESAQGPARRSRATMTDWALVDQPAARAAMRQRLPGVPLWVIGHSLGAMLMPLQDGIEDIVRLIGVASGLVHHTDHPWPYQAFVRFFWFGPVPLVVRATGYLPGRRIGFGADLPAGVYWQWRRWCTAPDSYLPETGTTLPRPGWARSGAAVDLFAIGDDQMIPPACVWRLAPLFEGGRVRRHLVNPADFGLRKVGHLGLFQRRNAELWPLLVDRPPR